MVPFAFDGTDALGATAAAAGSDCGLVRTVLSQYSLIFKQKHGTIFKNPKRKTN